MREHVLHLRRHLAARDSLLVGPFTAVLGGEGERAFLGNGVHPDKKAHLVASEYAKAEQMGSELYLPDSVSSVLIAPSPLARADETARHMFLGMAREHARTVLGVDLDNLTHDGKRILSEDGLHAITDFEHASGLAETIYLNSQGEPDGANELVGQAYSKTVNPDFPGYRWMVQKGFEGDSRSEHPKTVADRALQQLIPALLQYDVVLSATHQPNLEIITAILAKGLGKDANELFENAGGAYGMGGGVMLHVYTDNEKIKSAVFSRQDNGSLDLTQMDLNMDTLKHYARQ